jgi:glyoxylase-like metal-dependent hydrolase (beta-lactamase superfamily II)
VRWTEVVPGVRRLWSPGIDNNAYLIAGAQGEAALVDSGPPRDASRLLASLRAVGVPPDRIGHIAVTHCHTDHTGVLAALVGATGARVYSHPIDAGIIRAGAERPRGRAHGVLGRIMLAMAGRPSLADAAPVDVEIGDGQEIPASGGLRCVHTPGHTAGHVSFLWPEAGGVLFVGDAAANMFRRLDIAPLNEDDQAARESFRKLAALEFSHACFGHGSPIRGRAATRFRHKLDRLAR